VGAGHTALRPMDAGLLAGGVDRGDRVGIHGSVGDGPLSRCFTSKMVAGKCSVHAGFATDHVVIAGDSRGSQCSHPEVFAVVLAAHDDERVSSFAGILACDLDWCRTGCLLLGGRAES